MSHYPASIRQLIKLMAKLPGIGEKTAERLALHLLFASNHLVEELARSILDVKQKVRLCSRCFSLSDGDLCGICSNPARDGSVVCVVEQPGDMAALEKSGSFNGVYHVLSACCHHEAWGLATFISGDQRWRRREVREVVLATGTSVEGEATAAYIAGVSRLPVSVTRIASRVPMG
jgi:recombination protein RecR